MPDEAGIINPSPSNGRFDRKRGRTQELELDEDNKKRRTSEPQTAIEKKHRAHDQRDASPIENFRRPHKAEALETTASPLSTGSAFLNGRPTPQATPTSPTPANTLNDDSLSLTRTATQTSSKGLPFYQPSLLGRNSSRPQKDLRWLVQKLRDYETVTKFVSGWKSAGFEELCADCDKLDLNYGSFVIGAHHSPEDDPTLLQPTGPRGPPSQGKKTLGSLREMLAKSQRCPLCRLVVKSLADQENTLFARITASLSSIDPPNKSSPFVDYNAVCEVYWQVDGRKKMQDQDGRFVEAPCTRRLSVQWKKNEYKEAHLVLIAPDVDFGPPNLFLGRLLTSGDISKHERIEKWYNLCSQEHGEKCAIDHENPMFQYFRKESYFGVIDIKNMKLAALPEKAPYAALSYTWGKPPQGEHRFRTTYKTVDKLKMDGGLREIEKDLPRTIMESIELAKKLGFEYLWVDALCIIQADNERDDDEEGHDGLWEITAGQMDMIYGHASLTICAADGEDSSAGLRALHASPDKHQERQCTEKISPNMQLMVTYPSESYVERSVWNQRAWTFQERVLSKRCLIFTDGKVYLQCRSTIMREDIYTEEASAGRSIDFLHGPVQHYTELDRHPIDVYKYSISLYTSRFLTKEQDILAAFSGICKEICLRLGGMPIYGLPNSHFDLFLLWKPHRAPNSRRKYGSTKFPSWSWCGWKGTSMAYQASFVEGCELNLHEWLMNHTWITWYIRDGHGNLRLVWDPKLYRKSSTLIESRWQGYCGKDDEPHETSTDLDDDKNPIFDNYQRRIPEDKRDLTRDKFTRTIPKYPFQVRLVPPGTTAMHHNDRLDDQRFLQFWTWSAYFYIVPEDPMEPIGSPKKSKTSNLVHYGIQDGNYNLVGSITLGSSWEKVADRKTKHEFIAVSDARSFSKEEIKDWAYVEPYSPGQTQWFAYNVFLLCYDDDIDGVARRAGLGKIYKSAFDTACPLPSGKRKEWKEIILG